MPTTWAVTPTRLPLIVRRCTRCGHDRFRASGAFRVNANGKLLDVWLLARCTTCEETLKVPVLERTHVRAVPAGLLDRLHGNDLDLVAELLHGRTPVRVVLDWAGAWRLDTGARHDEAGPDPDGVIEVSVRVEARIPVRPVRLIAAGLGLSRGEVERFVENGAIVASVDLRGRRSSDFGFLLKR